MRPDWKDAPEWANYLAMDGNGTWFWYEKKPFPLVIDWQVKRGKLKTIGKNNTNWKQTLEKRP